MSISAATVAEFRTRWTTSLPNGWRFAKFGEVLRMVKRPVEILDDHEYDQPVIRRGHAGIEIRDRQLGRDIKTKAQFQIRAGDWLMSKVQILHGAYGIVPPALDGAIASGTYFVFRPEPALDLRHLWYLSYLRQFHESCAVASVGVAIEKMVFRAEDWKQLEFPLPPLPEQKKIAAILSCVDEAIHATQRVINQARRVKEGLLQDLLTRGLSGHTRFKQTEIGEIPESWEVRRIETIGEVQLGRQKAPKYMAGNNPRQYLRVVNVTDDGLDLHDVAVMDFDQEEFSTYRLRTGDVLITEGDLVSAWNVGRTAVYRGEIEDCCFTNTLIRFRPHDPKDADFCNVSFCGMRARGVFARLSSGSTVQHLGGTRLKSVSLPWPPKDERAAINQVVSGAERTVMAALGALNQMLAMKAGLLADLLTGKVRVSP